MPEINRRVIVPHTALQMFLLVNDIAQYKEFVPGCVESVVDLQTDSEIRATLTLGAVGLQKSFTTRNTLKENAILIELVEGPFRDLTGAWQFHALDNTRCEVNFYLSFEFSSRMVGMMFGAAFEAVTSKLVEAFVARGREIYGCPEELTL